MATPDGTDRKGSVFLLLTLGRTFFNMVAFGGGGGTRTAGVATGESVAGGWWCC